MKSIISRLNTKTMLKPTGTLSKITQQNNSMSYSSSLKSIANALNVDLKDLYSISSAKSITRSLKGSIIVT